MKKTILMSVCLWLLAAMGYAQSAPNMANYSVIPLPRQINMVKSKGFVLTPQTRIVYPACDNVLKKDAELLASYIFELTGMQLKVATSATDTHNIELCTGLSHPNKEAYSMRVSAQKITIQGASAAGTFYGIQTFRKSIPLKCHMDKGRCEKEVGKSKKCCSATEQKDLLSYSSGIVFPAGEITDYPQYAYRGAMLDVARHFFGVDAVKTFIDMLALHNINNFHWHLTDDQGWRIEIKKYPLLTQKAAFRPETAIGHTDKKDGKPHGGYYTQQQIKEIVQYAAERHINIVPEIDMPGHMVAALSAYPKLGCTGGPYSVRTEWGIAEEVLCAGNDSTLQFAKDVIAEVMQLFPGPYINIGGDECPKKSWQNCAKCQAKIQSLGLVTDAQHTKEQRLQSYFMTEMANFITQHGRKVCGWDEILEGGVAPNATVLSWRGMKGSEQAARLGHDAIMCPTSHLYFDYYQTENRETEPIAFNGYIPIERTYDFNPISDKLTAELAKHIIGVQANLWTEQVKSLSHIEYMMLPRLSAACEVQWSNPEQKDYNDFIKRLPHLLKMYKLLGYNYAKHYFTLRSELLPSRKNGVVKVKLNSLKGTKMYYTLDGSNPTEHSILYKGPFEVKKSSTIKAVAFLGKLKSDVYTEEVKVHRALMKPVTYNTQPNHAYQGNSPSELVNGLVGNTFFHSGRWVGYTGNDMDVVIDLQRKQVIRQVTLRTLVDDGNWIFPDRGVSLCVSDDGIHFREVFKDRKDPMSEGKAAAVHQQTITLQNVKGRYLQVKILSEHQIPQWHYGKGNAGFLFVDEITVD